MTLNVGVIGYGYWGPNLVRNYVETPGSQVVAVSDVRSERLSEVQKRYPFIKTSTDNKDLFNDPTIDAILISTPVSSHYELAIQALQAGKHVLLEKPITQQSDQARRLIEEAARRKRVLMVDHTFIYTGAIRKIHDLITSGEIGDLYYYDSVRVNLGMFQHDVSVLWDLAVHDLSIMDYLLGEKSIAVSAAGISHIPGEPENTAYLTIFLENNLIAHIHVNWLAPVKIRRTLIGGSHKMIVYDDLEPSEKVRIYDKGINVSDETGVYKMLISYRTGDVWIPGLDQTEALRTQAKHFIECVETGKAPITDGQAGLRVVKLLEAATQSMAKRGQPFEI
ncbi:MAG: Gfo/Idh/MocA family oxidoreductase [Anaerolineales bacterium]|nr:Gfo/Idh/MocA family oxidoreductase [Anaerolineales bacterium]